MTRSTSPTLSKKLHEVRPRIEVISPIAGWGTLVYGVFNVLLGIALFTITSRFGSNIPVLSTVYNYQFWGALFFANGVFMIYSFMANDWNMMRRTHIAGMLFKTVWWFALVLRWSLSFGNPALLLIWSALTALQFLIYVYFLPVPPKDSA